MDQVMQSSIDLFSTVEILIALAALVVSIVALIKSSKADSLQAKVNELELAINNQKNLVKKMFQNGVAAKTQLDKYKESKDLGTLTRELLVTMVSKVYVHEGKKLDIVFRFSNELEKLKVINQMVQNDILKQGVV